MHWYRIVADVVFLTHLLVVLIALFGWLFPAIWPLYVAVLLGTIGSNILLERCFLSDWEFALRKVDNPTVDYDFSYSSYYTYKVTKQRIGDSFLRWAGIAFCSTSLVLLWIPRLFF